MGPFFRANVVWVYLKLRSKIGDPYFRTTFTAPRKTPALAGLGRGSKGLLPWYSTMVQGHALRLAELRW